MITKQDLNLVIAPLVLQIEQLNKTIQTMQDAQTNQWLTVKESAAFLGVTPQRLHAILNSKTTLEPGVDYKQTAKNRYFFNKNTVNKMALQKRTCGRILG